MRLACLPASRRWSLLAQTCVVSLTLFIALMGVYNNSNVVARASKAVRAPLRPLCPSHGINTSLSHVPGANELNCQHAGAARDLAAMDGSLLLPRPDACDGPLAALLLRSRLPDAGQGPPRCRDEPTDRRVPAAAGGAILAVATRGLHLTAAVQCVAGACTQCV